MTRILIIDDDVLLVKTIEFILEKEGYKTISALGGEEALKKLETIRPDLILLDLMMPGMGGWETLKRIKGDKALASTPVIILSVNAMTSDILAKKDKLGFADYMTKPFIINDLKSLIKKKLQS